MKYIHTSFRFFILFIHVVLFTGCADYLDVVPDGVATLDNAFSNRINAERFFFSCYNYLPNPASAFGYPANIGSDEIWWDVDVQDMANRSGARIATGQQNSTNPYQNYWDSGNDGKNMWIGIRDCNIFLEGIHRVAELQAWERTRWIAEVTFLKAYFHFFLLQLYGPIPIIRENLPVNASPEDVRIYREPVEDVIEYIVQLLDEAIENGLPEYIEETTTEMGRITIPIALSIKARVLVWAASPLFNGNPDYLNFRDGRGVQLVSPDEDRTKWERAAKAIKEAIDVSHRYGHSLYQHQRGFDNMSDTTLLKYTLRGAVTERPFENPEIIWGSTHDINQFQNWCTPKFFATYSGTAELSATLKIAEQYYTDKGVPIDEDPTWNYTERYETRADTGSFHRYYISPGETTANLNYYREPRFYAHLAFDRSIYEMLANTEDDMIVIKQRSGEAHGLVFQDCHPSTGYFIKKLVSFRSATTTTNPSPRRYSLPLVRLSDLYLLYAEALNEVKDVPDSEVYNWIDEVRKRAGLEGVVDSWSKYSDMPAKPTTKEGMREIIKRERLIELSFEGQRFFDLRRWKDAMNYMNEPVQGWDFQGTKVDDYYIVTTYYNNRNYMTKDYLWPLKNESITINSNLVQNPGW